MGTVNPYAGGVAAESLRLAFGGTPPFHARPTVPADRISDAWNRARESTTRLFHAVPPWTSWHRWQGDTVSVSVHLVDGFNQVRILHAILSSTSRFRVVAFVNLAGAMKAVGISIDETLESSIQSEAVHERGRLCYFVGLAAIPGSRL